VLGVVATIGEQRSRSVVAATAQGRQRVHECEQVAALVFVCAREGETQRDAAAVAGEVQL
jgi:hypothetical protein